VRRGWVKKCSANKANRGSAWNSLGTIRLREDQTEPIYCTVDAAHRIFVQPRMRFRGIATTQEISPIRGLASQFTMQIRKPSHALTAVGAVWQRRPKDSYPDQKRAFFF
jgi:hypothetical protein